jgi:hypothetical protein
MIKNKRKLISFVLGFIALLISFPTVWNRQAGDTPEKIKQVESVIKDIYQDKDGLHFVPVWNETEMNKLTDDLATENKSIATAKALMYYDENPIPRPDIFDKIEWLGRFTTSQQPWKIQTTSSKVLSSVAIAIGIGLSTTLAALFLLFVLPLIWFFMLQRISELSKAIQGKHGS